MDENTACCKNCFFAFTDGGNMICRRFPPSGVMVPQSTNTGAIMQAKQPQGITMVPVGVFPPVRENFWCGEYAEKTDSERQNNYLKNLPRIKPDLQS